MPKSATKMLQMFHFESATEDDEGKANAIGKPLIPDVHRMQYCAMLSVSSYDFLESTMR